MHCTRHHQQRTAMMAAVRKGDGVSDGWRSTEGDSGARARWLLSCDRPAVIEPVQQYLAAVMANKHKDGFGIYYAKQHMYPQKLQQETEDTTGSTVAE